VGGASPRRRDAATTRSPAGRPPAGSTTGGATGERRRDARSRSARDGRAKLSKDAYRRQATALEAELTRLGLRKNHLELALADPAVGANFVELRRVTSELADVERALAEAEEAWLELEERAPSAASTGGRSP
jgi:hypothetical protein